MNLDVLVSNDLVGYQIRIFGNIAFYFQFHLALLYRQSETVGISQVFAILEKYIQAKYVRFTVEKVLYPKEKCHDTYAMII